MSDTKELVDRVRDMIVEGEAKIQEAEKLKRRITVAKEFLILLLEDESNSNNLSGLEAALRVFDKRPGESLSISEVVETMKVLGWHSNSTKPESVVGGILHRDSRFERVGRGQYRLLATSEEVELGNGFDDVRGG